MGGATHRRVEGRTIVTFPVPVELGLVEHAVALGAPGKKVERVHQGSTTAILLRLLLYHYYYTSTVLLLYYY